MLINPCKRCSDPGALRTQYRQLLTQESEGKYEHSGVRLLRTNRTERKGQKQTLGHKMLT